MNRDDFLSELRYRLRRLPKEEIDNAINYYEEYFNDAGIQYEQRVINELISPSAIASKIVGEYAVADAETKRKKGNGINSLGVVLLTILVSPIALPLILAVFMLVLSLFFVYFSFGMTGALLVIVGVAAIVSGVWVMMQSFATGLFFIGAALFLTSLGIAIVIGIVRISKSTYLALPNVA